MAHFGVAINHFHGTPIMQFTHDIMVCTWNSVRLLDLVLNANAPKCTDYNKLDEVEICHICFELQLYGHVTFIQLV